MPTTALVLAGGGARGAYEAGALSVILPELDRRGERPTIYVGTSVGALNAGALAASQHLPVEEQVETVVATWRALRKSDVIRPILLRTGPLDVLKYAGQLLKLPRVRLRSVLDPAPLWESLPRMIDFDRIHDNVASGAVDALACVTTSARTGRTVVFVESAAERQFHRSHAVAYVPAQIEVEHVGASAAIPLLWPPVLIERPARARGWYVDGGTRLNAPIKPALDLDADRLVVAAVDSIEGPVMGGGEQSGELPPPDFGDGMLHLLEGALVDPLIEDMRTLGNVNAFFAEGGTLGATLYRTARGKAPYKRVPYIFVGPARRGAIGVLASQVYDRRYGRLGALRDPDFVLLNELLGGVSENQWELLSLLFFDEGFIEQLITMGRDDAMVWLESEHDGEGPWQIGPLGTFTRPRQWTAG